MHGLEVVIKTGSIGLLAIALVVMSRKLNGLRRMVFGKEVLMKLQLATKS